MQCWEWWASERQPDRRDTPSANGRSRRTPVAGEVEMRCSSWNSVYEVVVTRRAVAAAPIRHRGPMPFVV